MTANSQSRLDAHSQVPSLSQAQTQSYHDARSQYRSSLSTTSVKTIKAAAASVHFPVSSSSSGSSTTQLKKKAAVVAGASVTKGTETPTLSTGKLARVAEEKDHYRPSSLSPAIEKAIGGKSTSLPSPLAQTSKAAAPPARGTRSEEDYRSQAQKRRSPASEKSFAKEWARKKDREEMERRKEMEKAEEEELEREREEYKGKCREGKALREALRRKMNRRKTVISARKH